MAEKEKNSTKNSKKAAKKTVGKPFVKGRSGNPNGRPKLSDEERNARESSRREIAATWERLKAMKVSDLQKIDKAKMTVVEAWMIKAMLRGIQSGDTSDLHKFYDRLLGRPRAQDEAILMPQINVLIPQIIPAQKPKQDSDG